MKKLPDFVYTGVMAKHPHFFKSYKDTMHIDIKNTSKISHNKSEEEQIMEIMNKTGTCSIMRAKLTQSGCDSIRNNIHSPYPCHKCSGLQFDQPTAPSDVPADSTEQ
jgi:hypothetical protein